MARRRAVASTRSARTPGTAVTVEGLAAARAERIREGSLSAEWVRESMERNTTGDPLFTRLHHLTLKLAARPRRS